MPKLFSTANRSHQNQRRCKNHKNLSKIFHLLLTPVSILYKTYNKTINKGAKPPKNTPTLFKPLLDANKSRHKGPKTGANHDKTIINKILTNKFGMVNTSFLPDTFNHLHNLLKYQGLTQVSTTSLNK